jgi:hypothetical protein
MWWSICPAVVRWPAPRTTCRARLGWLVPRGRGGRRERRRSSPPGATRRAAQALRGGRDRRRRSRGLADSRQPGTLGAGRRGRPAPVRVTESGCAPDAWRPMRSCGTYSVGAVSTASALSGGRCAHPACGCCHHGGGTRHGLRRQGRRLRHSFVPLLSDAKVPIGVISRLVGHSGTAVTERGLPTPDPTSSRGSSHRDGPDLPRQLTAHTKPPSRVTRVLV